MTRARRLVIHRQCVQSLMDAGEWSAQLLFFDELGSSFFMGKNLF